MKNLLKENWFKIIIGTAILLIGFSIFGLVRYAGAHPGNTDAYGCHTCRTNCLSWGLSYGEYHCHQAKGLPQPEPPISCEYGTGCESAPYYEIPNYTPSIPNCPSMSYYDSISGSCKCYSGYVVSGGQCISADQYCQDLLGFNARYNILTDNCECSYGYIISGGKCTSGNSYCYNRHGYNSSYDSLSKSCKCNYGYVFNSSNQCVSEDDYCQDKYGYHSEYDSLRDGCKCKSGYIFNSTMTKCIDGDSYCQDLYGYHSSYDSLSKTCECDYGYEFKNSRCIEEEDEAIYFPTIPKSAPKPEPQTASQPEPESKPKEYNISPTEAQQPKKCDEGYVLSFDKKHCIKIPENAHAVDSPTDLWLCNDGYKEINNTCMFINQKEEPKEESIKLTVPENKIQKSKNFVANIWEVASGFFGRIFKKLF